MSQTFLDENPPMILDATCSRRKIWPAHATLRMDFRVEMKPELVADDRALPFRSSSLDGIGCDPPHHIVKTINFDSLRAARKRGPHKGKPIMWEDYWYWPTRAEWLDFIAKTNNEFARALKPDGILQYKITDSPNPRSVHLAELLKGMTNFEVVNHTVTPSRSRTDKRSFVHWLTMKLKCHHEGDLSRNNAGGLMCDECGQQIEDFWEEDEP